MFFDAIFFIDLIEHMQTMIVNISAAGWDKYIPFTPRNLGNVRMNGI